MSKILLDTFIYILVIKLSFNISWGFKVVNLHDFCGDTIYAEAGEVRFDSKEVLSYLPMEQCSVTVNPKMKDIAEASQVLFYFTQFELSEPCNVMNVTILDGSLFGGTVLDSLPKYICGHNTTLEKEDQFFTTKTDQFTLIFRGGECNGKNVFQCPNEQCVPSQYTCSDDVNACGSDRSHCDDVKVLKPLFDSILKVLKEYVWILVVIFGLCVLKSIFKRKRETICNMKESICSSICKKSTHRRDSSIPSLTNDDLAAHNEELTVMSSRENQDESLSSEFDTISSQPSSRPGETDHSRGAYYDDHNWTSPETDPINAPPPSYQEVIHNTNVYKANNSTW